MTYDAATDTAYLVPVTPVKPFAFLPANEVKIISHKSPYPFLLDCALLVRGDRADFASLACRRSRDRRGHLEPYGYLRQSHR